MKNRTVLLYAFLSILFFVVSCKNEKSEDFKKVSELIANRNSARYHFAGKNNNNKEPKKVEEKVQPEPIQQTKKEELSSVILYEEDIQIISESSKKTLAKGLAYLNEDGQIVRIRIIKE